MRTSSNCDLNSEISNLKSPLLLGLDLGTTNVKALVTDRAGQPLARASAPVQLHYVGEGGVEQDIEEIEQATLTAIQPSGKFGALDIGEGTDAVSSFQEKPKGDGAWINGGFFVCEARVFDYIRNGDETVWERDPLEGLASAGQLVAFKHEGFWQPMDTLRDKNELEMLWANGKAPWKVWA